MKNGTDGYGWRIRTTIEVDHDMKTAPCRLCFEIRDQYADENRGKMLRKIEWTNLETETIQTNEEFVESPLPYDLHPIWRDIISENIESVIESQFVEVA
jgi:hypothetical protein